MSSKQVVSVDNLTNSIMGLLNTYTDEVKEGVSNKSKEVAKEGAEKLRQVNRPSGEGGTAKPMNRRDWNKYSKGWQVKAEDKANYTSSVIHNKTRYQLTHLLEYGHITRNGTRTRAFKHIKPVDEYCQEKFVKEVEELIKRGGK